MSRPLNPDAPGFTTTEFWTTMLVHLVTGIVTISSLFTHTPFDASGLQPLIPVAALVMSGIAQAYYSHSRAHVKANAKSADTTVLTTQANIASAAPVASAPPVAAVSPASTTLADTTSVGVAGIDTTPL